MRKLRLVLLFVVAYVLVANVATPCAFAGSWSWLGPAGTKINAVVVSPNYPADLTVFASMDGLGVLRSKDGGASWYMANTGLSNWHVTCLAISPNYAQDHILFAGNSRGGVFRSSNGGDSWTAMPYDPGWWNVGALGLAVSPSFQTDFTVFAGTDGGYGRSADGGLSWDPMIIGGSISISPAYATDRTVFAAYGRESFRKSVDGGDNWAEIPTGISMPYIAVSPGYATDKTVFATSSGGLGRVYKSANEGESWTAVGTGSGLPEADFTCLALSPNFLTDATLFVGTNGGGVLVSRDGGSSWQAENSGLTNFTALSLAFSPGADSEVFVGTDGDGVFVYDDTPDDTSPPQPVTDLTAAAGDSKVELSWANPTGDDVAGVLVKRSTSVPPSTPQEGTTVAAVSSPVHTFSDTGLANGTTYYYSAFAFDYVHNYSVGATAAATPMEEEPLSPPSGSMSLNEGADSTNSVTVTVNSTMTRASEMRFNAGSGWTGWQPYAPSPSVVLSVGDGLKLVWAEFRSAGGTAALFDWIFLDTVPPRAPGSFAARAGASSVAISWTNPREDFDSVIVLQSSVGYANAPNEAGQTTVYIGTGESVAASCPEGWGRLYYTAFARDEAGNWSTGVRVGARRLQLSRPIVPSTVLRSRHFTAYGYLKPYHSGLTILHFYRYSFGHWVYVARRFARNYRRYDYAKYRLSTRFGTRGRYRVEAYHSDSTHLPTVSGYRYFYVR